MFIFLNQPPTIIIDTTNIFTNEFCFSWQVLLPLGQTSSVKIYWNKLKGQISARQALAFFKTFFIQQCLVDCGYLILSSFLNVLKMSLFRAFSSSFAEWKLSFTLNPWWIRKALLRTIKLKPAIWVSQTWLILLKPYCKENNNIILLIINPFAPELPVTPHVDPRPFLPLVTSSVLMVKDNFVRY